MDSELILHCWVLEEKKTILNILTEYKSLQTNQEELLSIHCWPVLNLINIVHSVAL